MSNLTDKPELYSTCMVSCESANSCPTADRAQATAGGCASDFTGVVSPLNADVLFLLSHEVLSPVTSIGMQMNLSLSQL